MTNCSPIKVEADARTRIDSNSTIIADWERNVVKYEGENEYAKGRIRVIIKITQKNAKNPKTAKGVLIFLLTRHPISLSTIILLKSENINALRALP